MERFDYVNADNSGAGLEQNPDADNSGADLTINPEGVTDTNLQNDLQANVNPLDLMRLMIEQNRQRDELINNLLRANMNTNAGNILRQGEGPQQQQAYHIMPNLSGSIHDFAGEDDLAKAGEWLHAINSMAMLHQWQDAFKLESARGHLIGAASHWFSSRYSTIHNWRDFEEQFCKTFITSSNLGLPERFKIMQARVQRKGENIYAYFHEKVKLCVNLNLEFEDIKKQVLIGLWSKELCVSLMTQHHTDPDHLLRDIRNFEEVNSERSQRIGLSLRLERPMHRDTQQLAPNYRSTQQQTTQWNSAARVPASNCRVNWRDSPRVQNNNASVNNQGKGYRCYNCDKYGHLANECPEPRRPVVCRGCGMTGHTVKYCRNNSTAAREGTKREVNVVVEGKEGVGPEMVMKDVILNDEFNVRGLIDTGSSSCTITASTAIKCQLQIEPSDTVLYGFGNDDKMCSTVGKTISKVTIDGTVAEKVVLLVVPDTAQSVDMLIGRTWTGLPHIAYLKINDSLLIGDKNKPPFSDMQIDNLVNSKVQLTVRDYTVLKPNSINFVNVCAKGVKDEIIMIEKPGELGKLCFLKDGAVTLPILNMQSKEISMKPGVKMGRAEIVNMTSDNVEEYCAKTRPQVDTESSAEIKRGDIITDQNTTEEQLDVLHDLLNEFRDCFATTLAELGCTDLVEMKITEKPGSEPVHCRPYHSTNEDRETIRSIVQDWKRNGIVSETRSPYSSPVLLVKKKTGEPRLVVDYRKLNLQTIKDRFPLPNIDDQLERLAECNLFTVLDLAHGYLQLPLADESKEKTAFVTQDETGQFERLMFGLANGPAEFQRLMNTALGSLRNTVALCYLDDVLIPSRDWKTGIENLRKVLNAFRTAKLTLKLKKCEFFKTSIEFLGFIITKGSIHPGERKTAAIREFKPPSNVHEVKRFIGLTGYFRRFVKGYAVRAEPLTRLTKSHCPFEWKEDQVKAFEDLKCALTSEPILQLYNPRAKTELHTDASSNGLAGILLQEAADGKMHIVYCVSKKTTDSERRYHSSKLELLAIIWSVDRLRQFLLGIHFTIVTDCQALVYMNAKKTTNPQIARWFSLLQEYDVEIRHRPGNKMEHVDALSRAPTEAENDTMEEIFEKHLEVNICITMEDQILMMQQSDEKLREIVEILKRNKDDRTTEERNQTNEYILENGRLFKTINMDGKVRHLYVIPKSMRKGIVVKFHDLMGHYSTDRTTAKILENYWFPGLRKYVRQHIHMCFDCLLVKVPAGKKTGLLHPIPPGNRPFSVIHVDHLGPFIQSSSKNQELLVLTDNLTKFVRLFPVRNTSTKYVIRSMEEFVLDKGLPDRIISDRASCFTSKEFNEYCSSHGITHILNSTKHPQANGQVERVNRTVLPEITLAIRDDSHRDWDKRMKTIERNLNNQINKSTGKTPFELLHGYRPRFNDGAMRALTRFEEDAEWEDPQKLQRDARESILKSQEKYKRYYDQKHTRGPNYDIGEIVFMRKTPDHTGLPTKTQAKYRGPLVVTKTLPGDTYRVSQLQAEGTRFYTTTAHVSQLKNWRCIKNEDEEISDSTDDEEAVSVRRPKRTVKKPRHLLEDFV